MGNNVDIHTECNGIYCGGSKIDITQIIKNNDMVCINSALAFALFMFVFAFIIASFTTCCMFMHSQRSAKKEVRILQIKLDSLRNGYQSEDLL